MLRLLVTVHELEMFFYVRDPVDGEHEFESPLHEVDDCDAYHDYDPPPDKKVDHLVEQVDGQYTLHRVVVYMYTHHPH